MKIRIRGNSIRYRLTMSEVETFSTTGYYEEHTSFGHRKFGYALKAEQGIDHLKASFDGDIITLMVPGQDARDWAGNSVVGFSHSLELEGGGALSLLLEKDFACLDETGEDQSDNYPNPRTQE